MNLPNSTEHRPEEINHQRCHEIAVQCVTPEDDPPVVTCECSFLGEPCPHFFWAPTDAPLPERPV
jgi:hypothetical protein